MTRLEQEKEIFDRGKAVLGKQAGGLIVNLIRSKAGDLALAAAAIEAASTKHSPREYIGGVIRAGGQNGYRQPAPPRPHSQEWRRERTSETLAKLRAIYTAPDPGGIGPDGRPALERVRADASGSSRS